MNSIGAIILAAGKGKRMRARKSNKVTYMLGDKPMIMHTVHLLGKMKINTIIIVIGFAKESVMSLFDKNVLFAEQRKRLGTAHATAQALKILPTDIKDVFVLNGDDSAFYSDKVLKRLLSIHYKNQNALTFLTIKVENPYGLGRIIRKNGEVTAIIEEKDATEKQRKITEINPACYLFSVNFLKKYIHKVPKSKVTKEYYLMSLVEIAMKNDERVQGVNGGNIPWRGVNTGEELKEAEKLYSKTSGLNVTS